MLKKIISQKSNFFLACLLAFSKFSSVALATDSMDDADNLKWIKDNICVCGASSQLTIPSFQKAKEEIFPFPQDLNFKDSEMSKLLQYNHLLVAFLCANLACSKDASKPEATLVAEDNDKKQETSEKNPGDDSDKSVHTDPNSPGDENEQCPKDDKRTQDPVNVTEGDKPKTPPQTVKPVFTRGTPPLRAQFATEDLGTLQSLFYSSAGKDLPKAFRKLAEIFQFENFRAVPTESVANNSSEPHRVLLLGYNVIHLKKTINFFAAIAKSMSEDGVAADSSSLRSFSPLDVVSLESPKAADGTLDFHKSKIIVHINAADSKFIKHVPLNDKTQKLWPEALQLEFSFGGDRILFIFPSVFTFTGLTTDLLEGKTLLQTPWILRALEGETLSALWQAVSESQVDQNIQQMGSRELLYRIVRNSLFESIWDERSAFFPKQNAFRIVDTFNGPGKNFQGSGYFGYQDLKLATVAELKSQFAKLNRNPRFTFKNTTQPTEGN